MQKCTDMHTLPEIQNLHTYPYRGACSFFGRYSVIQTFFTYIHFRVLGKYPYKDTDRQTFPHTDF